MTALVSCWLAGRVPHLARGADHRRHRGVDDDVARHVQVGDAAVGVDHGERRGPSARPCCDVRLDRGALGRRAASAIALEQVGQAVVGADAAPRRGRRRARRTRRGRTPRTACPKMIGSDTFIIVALRCSENSTPLALASAICAVRKSTSAALAHDRGVDDLAGEQRGRRLEHGDRAVGARRARCGRRWRRPTVMDRSLRAEVAARPSWRRGSSSRATRRPSSAGSCGRTPSPRPGPGGRSCPRAAPG